jgi:hypothetical protein
LEELIGELDAGGSSVWSETGVDASVFKGSEGCEVFGVRVSLDELVIVVEGAGVVSTNVAGGWVFGSWGCGSDAVTVSVKGRASVVASGEMEIRAEPF